MASKRRVQSLAWSLHKSFGKIAYLHFKQCGVFCLLRLPLSIERSMLLDFLPNDYKLADKFYSSIASNLCDILTIFNANDNQVKQSRTSIPNSLVLEEMKEDKSFREVFDLPASEILIKGNCKPENPPDRKSFEKTDRTHAVLLRVWVCAFVP